MSIFDTKKVYFSNKYAWLCVVPILLLSFGLAIPHFMRDAVWFDEAYTHLFSGTGRVGPISLIQSLLLTAKIDRTPPAYYLINIVWGRLTGAAPFSDYVLPAYIGLLAISFTFQLAKKLFGSANGIIASLMLATSAIFIHYTHEHRTYTLFILAIALVIWFYWTIVTRQNYRRRWLRWGFPLSIALSLYTHYVSGAFILGIFVYHYLFERPDKSAQQYMSPRRWADINRLWINGCLLFVPWFAMLLAVIAAESGDDRGLPIITMIRYAVYSFTNNLWWIMLVLMFGSLLQWKKPVIRFLWVLLLTSLIVVGIINIGVNFLFHPRHILPYLLFTILLTIPTLDAIRQYSRVFSYTLVGLYAVLGIYYSLTPNFMYVIPSHIAPMPLNVAEDMLVTEDSCVEENEPIIFFIDTPDNEILQETALQYYFGLERPFRQLGQLVTDLDEDKNIYLQEDAVYEERVADFVSESEQVWLMTLPDLPNTDNLLRLDTILVNQGYHQCPILSQYQHANIWFYTTEDNCDVITNSCQ